MRHLRNPNERGAALIITVVVIMVLTTLALAMTAFTGTEERTAVTYRDSSFWTLVRSMPEQRRPAGLRSLRHHAHLSW